MPEPPKTERQKAREQYVVEEKQRDSVLGLGQDRSILRFLCPFHLFLIVFQYIFKPRCTQSNLKSGNTKQEASRKKMIEYHWIVFIVLLCIFFSMLSFINVSTRSGFHILKVNPNGWYLSIPWFNHDGSMQESNHTVFFGPKTEYETRSEGNETKNNTNDSDADCPNKNLEGYCIVGDRKGTNVEGKEGVGNEDECIRNIMCIDSNSVQSLSYCSTILFIILFSSILLEPTSKGPSHWRIQLDLKGICMFLMTFVVDYQRTLLALGVVFKMSGYDNKVSDLTAMPLFFVLFVYILLSDSGRLMYILHVLYWLFVSYRTDMLEQNQSLILWILLISFFIDWASCTEARNSIQYPSHVVEFQKNVDNDFNVEFMFWLYPMCRLFIFINLLAMLGILNKIDGD